MTQAKPLQSPHTPGMPQAAPPPAKVMLLTKQLDLAPRGGREMLCKLNHVVLDSIFGERLVVFELPPARPANLRETFTAFLGHIDGLTAQTIDDAINHIQRENVRQVFVDGSNLGGFVSALKRRLIDIEVITFFHNVEARFFWGALATAKSSRALAVFIANFLAERKAARLSDKLICLSERDSRLLKRLYGRGATHIAPIALEDNLPSDAVAPRPTAGAQPFALFVGGNFYANRVGIVWFVKHVAPHVDIRICIIGKGMQGMRRQLEIPGRVEVIGPVDSLAEWYSRARFVIAPIFDGSGMKTKVAEALMHGKKVVGTPEAFSGYEQVAARGGWCCSSPTEFVSAINAARTTITSAFDPELRALYEEHFSLSAATARLAEALGETRDF
jgi:glycosyltransferase involved in cell wall biosynthesis